MICCGDAVDLLWRCCWPEETKASMFEFLLASGMEGYGVMNGELEAQGEGHSPYHVILTSMFQCMVVLLV